MRDLLCDLYGRIASVRLLEPPGGTDSEGVGRLDAADWRSLLDQLSLSDPVADPAGVSF